ncbi:MAG: hypothetical protein WCC17_01440 [Candidatus Nitrosopolaris sp.]
MEDTWKIQETNETWLFQTIVWSTKQTLDTDMFVSYVRQYGRRPLTDKERERLEELQEQLRNAPDSDDYDDD